MKLSNPALNNLLDLYLIDNTPVLANDNKDLPVEAINNNAKPVKGKRNKILALAVSKCLNHQWYQYLSSASYSVKIRSQYYKIRKGSYYGLRPSVSGFNLVLSGMPDQSTIIPTDLGMALSRNSRKLNFPQAKIAHPSIS